MTEANDDQAAREAQLHPERTRFFDRAKRAARSAVSDPTRLRSVLDDAEQSPAKRSGPFEQIVGEFLTLLRLVRAYANGSYREVPRERMVLIVAAIIYVATPLDIIPDFLPGGFVDDAAIVLWVLRQVRDEVAAFGAWERGRREDGGQADPAALTS